MFQRLISWHRRRRFSVAKTIYLARYTYSRQSADERARIAAWIKTQLEGNGYNAHMSMYEFEKFFSGSSKAPYRAVAMKALGIAPSIEGEQWEIADRHGWWGWNQEITRLQLQFRPYNPTTTAVEMYLKSKGLDVSTIADP